MGQHIKPDTTEYMTISPEADKALAVWNAILDDRICAGNPTHKSRMHYDRIDAVLAKTEGTVYGHLLAIAIADARTREQLPADDLGEGLRASWDMAVRLRDEEHRINPPPQLIRIEQPTTCRHDVAYADVCTACDAEFA